MNTFAGYTLNNRNPKSAPAAAQVTGSMPEAVPRATTEKNTATINVTLPASPSSPSVKFVPLAVPRTIKNRTGIFHIPKSRYPPDFQGIFIARLISV